MRKIVLVAVTALLAGCQGADPPREAADKPPAPQSRVAPEEEAPTDPSVPGKRCYIRDQPCTPEQVAAIAATQEKYDRIRENERRSAEAAGALGRPPGYVTTGDPREYVWQQWGGWIERTLCRRRTVSRSGGSTMTRKAVSLVDDRVYSAHW